MRAKYLLRRTYQRARKDLNYFVRKVLRLEPTWQQQELLDAVMAGKKKIAVKSGQGPGKTTISGAIGLWLAWRKRGAMGVVTAPTMRQCREVWLAECRRLLQRAVSWFQKCVTITATAIRVFGSRDWGVKTVTATNSQAAQGFHAEDLFVICEEASGVSRELITQYKGTLSNPNAFFLMIGNPNTRDCEFFNCFTANRDKWYCLTFNAEETPRSSWFDPLRNEELAEEFGRNSDVYRVRVLGEFPHVDPNCVFSHELVTRCTDIRTRTKCALASKARAIGIDLARYGSDESVAYLRQGNAVIHGRFWDHTDPSEVMLETWRWQKARVWSNESCTYIVDATGMGQGILHRFYDANKRVHEFHNGGKPARPRKFHNKISEAWFTLAYRAKRGLVYFPHDRQLVEQLTSRQYEIHPDTGLIKIESKKDYIKRGHQSPDRADALVMAFYEEGLEPDGAVTALRTGKQAGQSHKRR